MVGLDWLDLDFFFITFFRGRSQNLSSAQKCAGPGPGRGPARPGPGPARPGLARPGQAWPGHARPGLMRLDEA